MPGILNGTRRILNGERFVRAGVMAILMSPLLVSHAGDPKPDESPVSALDAQTAAPSVLLAYKFQAGQFVHYQSSNRIQYLAQVEDRRYDSMQHNESGTHFRVVSVDEEGQALIEPVIDRTRMTAKMPDKEPVIFDSTADEPPSPQFQLIRESLGRPMARFQVAPNGKLIKAIIVDANAPKSMRDAAEQLNTRLPFLVVTPAAPVKVGDQWKENYNTFVTVGKTLKQPVPLLRLYEVTSIKDGVATIKFKTTVLARLDDPEQEKQIAQQTPSGTIEFDFERGLLRSHAATLNKTVINAFGPQTLLHVVGEATEKLVEPAEATAPAQLSNNEPSRHR